MGKLSDDEQAQLDALTKKSQQEDDGDDYDVEFWEEDAEGKRRGGRAPWKTGKKIYGQFFPDLFGEKPPTATESDKTPARERLSQRFSRGAGDTDKAS